MYLGAKMYTCDDLFMFIHHQLKSVYTICLSLTLDAFVAELTRAFFHNIEHI